MQLICKREEEHAIKKLDQNNKYSKSILLKLHPLMFSIILQNSHSISYIWNLKTKKQHWDLDQEKFVEIQQTMKFIMESKVHEQIWLRGHRDSNYKVH